MVIIVRWNHSLTPVHGCQQEFQKTAEFTLTSDLPVRPYTNDKKAEQILSAQFTRNERCSLYSSSEEEILDVDIGSDNLALSLDTSVLPTVLPSLSQVCPALNQICFKGTV